MTNPPNNNKKFTYQELVEMFVSPRTDHPNRKGYSHQPPKPLKDQPTSRFDQTTNRWVPVQQSRYVDFQHGPFHGTSERKARRKQRNQQKAEAARAKMQARTAHSQRQKANRYTGKVCHV